jgi:hypothetical protein
MAKKDAASGLLLVYALNHSERIDVPLSWSQSCAWRARQHVASEPEDELLQILSTDICSDVSPRTPPALVNTYNRLSAEAPSHLTKAAHTAPDLLPT